MAHVRCLSVGKSAFWPLPPAPRGAAAGGPGSLAGMPSMPPPDLRRGDWLRRNHTGAGYVSSQAFRTTSPRWVFGSDGPLAAWCAQYPRGADERTRDVYQFGVYTGGTMAGVVLYLRDLRVRFGTLWGFDSFVGLPAEAPGMNLVTPNWRPGAYSAADALGRWRWSRLKWEILHKIRRPASEGNVSLIRGFFNATLTPTLAAERRMSPALYVDIDADLYLSTTQAHLPAPDATRPSCSPLHATPGARLALLLGSDRRRRAHGHAGAL